MRGDRVGARPLKEGTMTHPIDQAIINFTDASNAHFEAVNKTVAAVKEFVETEKQRDKAVAELRAGIERLRGKLDFPPKGGN